MEKITTQALEKAQKLLEPWAEQVNSPEENRLDVVVKPQDLKAAFGALVQDEWGYLAAISALDLPAPAGEGEASDAPAEGRIEVLYHLCRGAAVATLRVRVPYSDAVIPSICDLYPAATLYEREAMELLGVVFEGTPDSEHLVLPDEWPAGVYPLRKSFTGFGDPADATKGETE